VRQWNRLSPKRANMKEGKKGKEKKEKEEIEMSK